jgi:molecular chaperone GrpE
MNPTTKTKKDKKEKDKKNSPTTKSSTSEKKVEKEKQTVQDLEKSNEELSSHIKTLEDSNLRLRAEMENKKKDFLKEVKEISEILKYNVSKELIKKILPLFDSYERAIKISQTYQDPKIEQFLVGFQMTFAEAQNDFFKKEGIEEIKITPQKDIYNRELHDPQQVEENNDYPEGTILEVLKKGYLYQNKILRLAEVKVSKKKV